MLYYIMQKYIIISYPNGKFIFYPDMFQNIYFFPMGQKGETVNAWVS
jgi:hypothetical protein